ncbi:sensor histidine kinase [Streptomyces indicus]|uniref:histidine kinase n=1 Tax=Streptomyces indicus TaxID=417292 RepID=A0A1G9HUC1_9ACTN|nr:HAMP domain-containing sensor histidine kinase [Streptomyces indicus]SDL16442.1 Signal transduction histidine kinase [Streptomyces indicus]
MKRSLSIHARLFLGFASALAVCAALMVAIIYGGMRFLPSYGFSDTVIVDPSDVTDVLPGKRLPASGGHADISSKEDVWNTVLLISVGGVLVVGALGLTAGWFLSKRLLAPLHTINEAARKAAAGNLSDRIGATGPPDELHQLADTFDEMLARLEESFAAHQRFAANASHELLTPLATTRAALQVAGDSPAPEELAELLPMLRETNDRNIAVVRALLDLASADQALFDTGPVDVSALARGVAEECGPRAAAAGLTLDSDIEPSCASPGNTTLLRQLLLNLLDNALTHNVPGGSAHLSVSGTERVTVEVTNTGPHLEQAQVDRLFEPFYRAAPRITSDRSGHGLGLALVRSITLAHHGTLTATALPTGGLTLRVELPRTAR